MARVSTCSNTMGPSFGDGAEFGPHFNKSVKALQHVASDRIIVQYFPVTETAVIDPVPHVSTGLKPAVSPRSPTTTLTIRARGLACNALKCNIAVATPGL